MKAGREVDALVAEKVKPYKCRSCGGSDFFAYKDGRRSCKPCAKAQRKRWRQNNPEKQKVMQRRWQMSAPDRLLAASHKWKLKHRYGMTEDEYNSMHSAQCGMCMICMASSKKKLTVDHCHATGAIRGLLCNGCNRALGWMNDDPLVLERGAKYLRGEL